MFYRWRHGRWPRLGDPRSFTEWVQWRKLNERGGVAPGLADKQHSKDIALARLGEQHVVPTLWLGAALPREAPAPFPFIVKANHGCGHSLVVRDPVDYARARILSRRWVDKTYGATLEEWQYRWARHLVLVEPLVGSGGRPIDYKVYVFRGRAEAIQVHVGRGRAHRWSQFDRDWAPLSDDPVEVPPPPLLAEMIVAAERMAQGETFVRVDFYCEGGRLWFGEYCLYPGSGLDPFRPQSLDDRLGRYWSAAA